MAGTTQPIPRRPPPSPSASSTAASRAWSAPQLGGLDSRLAHLQRRRHPADFAGPPIPKLTQQNFKGTFRTIANDVQQGPPIGKCGDQARRQGRPHRRPHRLRQERASPTGWTRPSRPAAASWWRAIHQRQGHRLPGDPDPHQVPEPRRDRLAAAWTPRLARCSSRSSSSASTPVHHRRRRVPARSSSWPATPSAPAPYYRPARPARSKRCPAARISTPASKRFNADVQIYAPYAYDAAAGHHRNHEGRRQCRTRPKYAPFIARSTSPA